MVRILLFSDIHANLGALEAVLEDADQQGPFDLRLNLGDTVGYGPKPNECIELVKSFISLRGNHDYSIEDNILAPNTNPELAIKIHRRLITPEHKSWLASLPFVYTDREHRFAAAHASFEDDDQKNYYRRYILCEQDAEVSLNCLESLGVRIGFYGHTHVPALARKTQSGDILFRQYDPGHSANPKTETFDDFVCNDNVILINPGSVGQSRNQSPSAHYAIVEIDTKTRVILKTVAYDIAQTQHEMRELGMPPRLIERLKEGT